jgi:hypothetical protein
VGPFSVDQTSILVSFFLWFAVDISDFVRIYAELARTFARSTHGFDSVHEQIENHLLQLDFISQYQG